MRGTWGKYCPHCKQEYPASFIAERKEIANMRRLIAIERKRKAGEKIGRPCKLEKRQVQALRSNGQSIRDIALALNVSAVTVWRYLK